MSDERLTGEEVMNSMPSSIRVRLIHEALLVLSLLDSENRFQIF